MMVDLLALDKTVIHPYILSVSEIPLFFSLILVKPGQEIGENKGKKRKTGSP